MSIVDEKAAWLALHSVTGVGDRTFWQLVGAYGGAAPVLEAARAGSLDRFLLPRETDGEGSGTRPLPRTVIRAIRTVAEQPTEPLRILTDTGVWTTTPLSPDYPGRLRELDPMPPVLYGWGDRAVVGENRCVAIVGTRRPTPLGRQLAARIAAALAGVGAVVISGLAIGIDGAAHAAAVEHGGRSVGVIGGGHLQPGPRAHRRLVERLVERGGAVISELPPAALPSRGTFPRRNRLISILSEAVIVVEAPIRSGAMITARHALEQGRPLFALPGRPNDRMVAGTLSLLRETPARPIVGVDELLVDLGYVEADESGAAPRSAHASAALSATERAVAQALHLAPRNAEGLADATGLLPRDVAGALTMLMLRGWVSVSGSTYLASGTLLLRPPA